MNSKCTNGPCCLIHPAARRGPVTTGRPPASGGYRARRPAAVIRGVLGLAAVLCLAFSFLSVSATAGPREGLLQSLGGLDPTRIPTRILYDRVTAMSGLVEHDGQGEAHPVTIARWRQMLHEMTLASLAEPTWPTVTQLREEARSARDSGLVPIAVLSFRYNRIRPDALDRGLLVRRQGRLIEGDGVQGSEPYLEARAFAAVTLVPRTYRGERVEFELRRDLFVGNDPAIPSRVEIDFADGHGFRPVRFGERVAIAYDSPGRKIIRLQASFVDSAVLKTSFHFEVITLQAPVPHETWPITATIPYQAVHGTGEAYVYLADGHAILTEPVIIAEGFDLDNTMGWDELYALLNQEDLLETLRADGYDAVVLNFTEATEPIQRNAFVLVELIEQVQAAQADGRDVVVIGASMGGLVARYAMAYMESEGMDHRSRTFISFDVPQTGANIPLGMQYWLDFFQVESADAAYLLSRLDTPAARQMLLYHHTDPPGSTGESDPLRADFLADLAAVGDYPALLRKVAVANGSGYMTDQGFAAGDQIILYEYSSFLVDIIGNVWAVPDGTSQLIFDGLIDRIWPLQDDQMAVTVSGTLPWDSAPGGDRGSMAQMDTTEAPYGDIVALHDNHCFTPTISALGLATSDPFHDIAGDPDLLSLTPFDAVHYPVLNQEHILITAESKAWFIDEIERPLAGVTPDPDIASLLPVLQGNYPNPFNPSTAIRFSLPAERSIRLGIFDAGGRLIRPLARGVYPAGSNEVEWNGRDESGRRAASGVYYCRLEVGAFSQTGRMTLIR